MVFLNGGRPFAESGELKIADLEMAVSKYSEFYFLNFPKPSKCMPTL